jgi:hypothetical protein
MLGFAWAIARHVKPQPAIRSYSGETGKKEQPANRQPAGAHAWRRDRGQGNPRDL